MAKEGGEKEKGSNQNVDKNVNKASTRSHPRASKRSQRCIKKSHQPTTSKRPTPKRPPGSNAELGRAARLGLDRESAWRRSRRLDPMRQRTAPARLGETHASSLRRARLRIAAFCDAIARWVRRIGEAGLSLIPKQSISRFGNQSIGNGSAIAARCVIAEKRRERLISLCSLKAGQRVDIPKRLQSRRAHRLQPPCPRAQRKTPRRAKSGREGFSFDFSTHQRKRRRRRRLQRFSTHCFVFFSAYGGV